MSTGTADRDLVLRNETRHRELTERLLRHLEGRVAYADLCIEEIAKLEYNRLVSGEEMLKPYTSRGALQLRLLGEGGRKLEVSLGLLPFDELRDDLDFAVRTLALQEKSPRMGLAPVPNRDRVRYGEPVSFELRGADVGPYIENLAGEIRRLAEEAVEGAPAGLRDRLEVETEVWAYYQVEEKLIADSEGLFKTQVLPSTFLSVTAKARDRRSGRVTEQRARLGDIRPLDWLFEPGGHRLRGQHREALGRWMRRAVHLHEGRKLGRDELARLTHYVLDSTAMVFVHEAQGHNFEADIVRDGSSGLLRPDGSPAQDPLGPPLVDLYDGPVRRRDGTFDTSAGFGTHYIDDEGVEVQPVQLVKNGRIADMLHSRETAHYFGVTPNGRGFSELGDPRIPRMTNTYLYPAEGAPWHDGVETLVSDVPFGLLLEGSKGGAVSKDGMSTTIQSCRLIRDGRVVDDVLLPANMTVRTLTALEGVEGFAGPLQCNDPGFCGKGQTKTVTDGGPITRIRRTDAITIGF